MPANSVCTSPAASQHSASSHTSPNNKSNLSKSASQSSILSIFKSTFSPFAIRKWRSKSRDKLLIKSEQLAYEAEGMYVTPPPPPPSATVSQQASLIKLSISKSRDECDNPQQVTNTNSKYQKNQQTANTIKLRQGKQVKKPVDDEPPPPPPPPPAPLKQTLDSSVSSSLASSPSSLDQRPRIQTSFSTSPRSDCNTPRNTSERIKLTCLLNGYVSSGTPVVDTNSQLISPSKTLAGHAKSPAAVDKQVEFVEANEVIMKKSSEMLDNSERFYNLKKKAQTVVPPQIVYEQAILPLTVTSVVHTPAPPVAASATDAPIESLESETIMVI